MLLIGSAGHPGPGLGVELINVGGWLSNCDEALETEADSLVVTQHRLVLARTRSESKSLKTAGIFSLWTPACQESAHVGHASVGLVSMRGLPFLMLFLAHMIFALGLGEVGCCRRSSRLEWDVLFMWWWFMGFKGLIVTLRN